LTTGTKGSLKKSKAENLYDTVIKEQKMLFFLPILSREKIGCICRTFSKVLASAQYSALIVSTLDIFRTNFAAKCAENG
jgi:hypothetical protein